MIPVGDWAAAMIAAQVPGWLVSVLGWVYALAVPLVWLLGVVAMVLLCLYLTQLNWCEPRR